MEGELLPSGKIVTIQELAKFCYDLSETDVTVLLELLDQSPKDVEELSKKLNLSKAVLSKSLAKLYSLGFIKRYRKIEEAKIGRPKYLYVSFSQEVKEKMKKDIERCSEAFKKFIEKSL